MFARTVIAVALFAVGAPAIAGNGPISQISEQTGVSERHVRMVAGARSAYAEYRIVYDRVEQQLKTSLGEEGFARLLAGDLEGAATRLEEQAAKTRLATSPSPTTSSSAAVADKQG